MRLWRLSGKQHAGAFDGGYGLLFDGRWNRAGYAITYCATSPSLCVLEKLVHIEDPQLLPDLIMIVYEAPDSLGFDAIALEVLPQDWPRREGLTQQLGEAWRRSGSNALLRVPSAIVPIAGSPDLNVLINHNHPQTGAIRLAGHTPFSLDSRLF
jgi:RES domain-containing protein